MKSGGEFDEMPTPEEDPPAEKVKVGFESHIITRQLVNLESVCGQTLTDLPVGLHLFVFVSNSLSFVTHCRFKTDYDGGG